MEAGDDPDVRLMLAAQAGSSEAFQQLYAKYARQIVRFALQFCGSQARAEELAQDVFLQVYKARATYEARARFTTWLFRIATNTCLSEMRRPEHRHPVASLDASDEDQEGGESRRELADPESPEGESAALAGEKRARLQHLLAAVPPQQRAALLLARAEGFSYDEVAETLGCSVPAVKSLIHRATVTLRDGMRRYESGEE